MVCRGYLSYHSPEWLRHINLLMQLSAICETVFHYQDKIPPIDYVVNVSLNMPVIEASFFLFLFFFAFFHLDVINYLF